MTDRFASPRQSKPALDVRQGVAQGGPMDGQFFVRNGGRHDVDDGFYVHRSAAGPKPAYWQWIASKGKTE